MTKNNSTTKEDRSFATLRLTKGKTLRMTKGFTMIEIIVILFIVSIGIVGVLSLIVQNISSQSYDKNNLIAAQLAQEGIELIRKVRDSNWKAGSSFDWSLTSTEQYYMDYSDAWPHAYSGNPEYLILKQDDLGFYHNYNFSPATSTIFSRLITVTKLNAYSLQVNSAVTWSDRQRNYSYNLETLLYDWK